MSSKFTNKDSTFSELKAKQKKNAKLTKNAALVFRINTSLPLEKNVILKIAFRLEKPLGVVRNTC